MKDYAGDVRRFCDLTGVKLADATFKMVKNQFDEVNRQYRSFLDAVKVLDSEPTDAHRTELLSNIMRLAYDLMMFGEMCACTYSEEQCSVPDIDVDENVSYINEEIETFTPISHEPHGILVCLGLYLTVTLTMSKYHFWPCCIDIRSCAFAAKSLKEYCATQGFDFDGAWDAMHEANMNRFYHDEDGKLIERKDYKRPDLAKFIGSEE